MKKAIIFFAAILIIALSGCSAKAPVNQTVKNGNGTPALNIIQGNAPTPSATETAALLPTDNPTNETAAVSAANDGNVIEIKEKMFVAQTNDVYYNAEDYLGKTIKYEGIFDQYTWEENGVTYCSVFRYGPGCCGTDANAGFEVIWDNEYPEPNDWVEAVGVLEEYAEGGYTYLRLALTSLTVLDARGEEYVTQ